VFFINSQLGWIANGANGNIFKTTDGGENWAEVLNEEDISANVYYRNIEFFDENNGIVTSLSGLHYKTTDGGTTWSPIAFPNNPTAICGLSQVSNTIMYGCGAYNEPAFILKTTDAGESWAYSDLSAHANALVEVLFLNEMLGYAAGKDDNGAVILKTTDGGITWTQIFNSNIAGEYVWKLQFVNNDPNILFGSIESVPMQQGKVIKSFDAGTTWESKDCPIRPIQALGFETPQRGWVGGHIGNLYETNDGGDTWTDLGYGTNANRIFFIDNTAYSSGSTILKLTETLSVPKNTLESRRDLNVVISPMPIKESLNFSIEYTETDNAIIELYDQQGRLLKKLARESLVEKGVKNYSFNFIYASGLYFISIQHNTGRQSIQFIKE
jgi:photosystem II stability/assembly factor-like uncharacterized protein